MDNGEGGHEDLVFQVYGLTERLSFDTYYFVLAIEPIESLAEVRHFVADYLESWVDEINAMQVSDERCFPIDISDQYVGCVWVRKDADALIVNYGWSPTEGHSMDLKSAHKYFNGIPDFRSDIPSPLKVGTAAVVGSLLRQAEGLKAHGKYHA